MKKGSRTAYLLVALCIITGILVACAGQPSAPKVPPIVVGVPIPRASHTGQNGERSIILAAEEINNSGGINIGGQARMIQLELVDDRDQEPGIPTTDVLLGIEKLILEKKVDFCVGGPALSEAAQAALDVYAKYKVIDLIIMGAASPSWDGKVNLQPDLYRHSFNLEPNALDAFYCMGVTMGILKDKYGFNKMWTESVDTGYNRATAPVTSAIMKNQWGWEIVGEGWHPMGTTDFSSSLNDAVKSGAQLIYCNDQQPSITIFASQWYSMKAPAFLLGFLGPMCDPDMYKQTEGKCNYIALYVSASGGLPGLTTTPLTKPFFDAFVKRWGVEGRDFGTANGYTGMYLMKNVIEKTQSLDSDVLAAELAKTDMVTVSGQLKFNVKHRAVYGSDPNKAMVDSVMQWQDGKRVTIAPLTIKNGDLILPPWLSK